MVTLKSPHMRIDPSFFGTGTIGAGATCLIMDYGAFFSLVATLAVNTAPYRRELHRPSDHMALVHWTYRT